MKIIIKKMFQNLLLIIKMKKNSRKKIKLTRKQINKILIYNKISLFQKKHFLLYKKPINLGKF